MKIWYAVSVDQRVNVANTCDRLSLCFRTELVNLLPSSFITTVSVSRPKILPSEKTSLAGVAGLFSNTSVAIWS